MVDDTFPAKNLLRLDLRQYMPPDALAMPILEGLEYIWNFSGRIGKCLCLLFGHQHSFLMFQLKYCIYIFAVYTSKCIYIYVKYVSISGYPMVSSYLQADYLQICRQTFRWKCSHSPFPPLSSGHLSSFQARRNYAAKKAGGNNNIAKKLKRKNSSSKFFRENYPPKFKRKIIFQSSYFETSFLWN